MPAFEKALENDPLLPTKSWFNNRFFIEAWLGRGGCGETYRAYDRETGEQVTIKVFYSRANDASYAARCALHEHVILQRFDHPYVPRAVTTGYVDENFFLALSHAPGTSLLDLIRLENEPLAVERTLAIALPVLNALMHLDGRGMVHADVKPENVVVLEGKVPLVTLIDFGIAVRAGHEAYRSYTPSVASPQQERREYADGRDDQYCFGRMLYGCLAFKDPLEGSLDGGAVPIRTYRPGLPRGLANAIMKMMSPLREERYATWADVAAALLPFASTRTRERFNARRRLDEAAQRAFEEQRRQRAQEASDKAAVSTTKVIATFVALATLALTYLAVSNG